MKIERSELEPVYFVRIGKEQKFDDDYEFEFGGENYYVNKQVKENCGLLLFKVLDAFNAERKKVEKLERKVNELKVKIKAAKYDGFIQCQKLTQQAQTA